MTNTDVANRSSVPAQSRAQQDYILLDGSGSMLGKWFEMCDAIDAYVAGLQHAGVQSHLILHTFDSCDMEIIHRDQQIAQWTPLKDQAIGSHWGGTPLYDAINLLCRKLRDINPLRCSIVIVTDGKEQDSTHTTRDQAKALLDWCRAKGWQVTFIGCDFDNSKVAKLLGGHRSEAIGVDKRLLTDATKALAEKRARYGFYGENMHFSDDERMKFGGLLEHKRHD